MLGETFWVILVIGTAAIIGLGVAFVKIGEWWRDRER